ncbi:polysaccharide biosynthesis/export family protein [Bradyrhizobium sp.]|uniref:polysaccharide biosynthesis/export family protein n=1 Tax=Bradyrhizobium sp. TaxID=376 RepID=UPI0039E2CD19
MILFGAGLLLSGCALPASGPSAKAFNARAEDPVVPSIAVVEVSPETLLSQRVRPSMSLAARFGSAGQGAGLRLARGDVVTLSLWEAPPGTLFSTSIITGQSVSNTSTIAIPAQSVEADGTIGVPFAGRIQVVGDTPATVEEKISKALQGKAVQPQALVSVVKSSVNAVTVTGEVAGGSRVPLSSGGERILDAIAAAGGLRAPVHESVVELTRVNATARIRFDRLLNTPSENLYLQPGDTVAVVREPETFSVLGATGRNDELGFEATRMSMAQALAKAGGLQDARADATGVFLFRVEPVAVAAKLLPPDSPFLEPGAKYVPVVYRFNLQDPQVMFATSRFWMQPRDVVYVANATGAELQKFLTMIQGIVGPVLNGAAVAVAARSGA